MRSTKKLLVVVMALIMVLALTSCSDEMKLIGRWNITTVTAGDLVMDQDELDELGLETAGYLKLNKSGSCVVNLLGDEYEGTWKLESDGTVSISYGKESLGTATRDDKVLTFVDANGNEYKLEK